MTEANVRRWTGRFGLVSAVLILLQMPFSFMVAGAPPDWNILTRILLGVCGYVVFVAFLAGFRQIVRQADPAYECVATLAVAAGLVYMAVNLVAHSMEAGAAIAANPIDPTVDGSLAPGLFLLYGAIGRLLTALLAAAAGFAILGTGALPAWSGRLAQALAVVNLAFVPSVYFGADAARFYSAVGWGTTAVVAGFLLYWTIAVSIVLVRNPRPARAPAPASSGLAWGKGDTVN